jgi:serine phosphatase RsbU (regulator of sigma subunit)
VARSFAGGAAAAGLLTVAPPTGGAALATGTGTGSGAAAARNHRAAGSARRTTPPRDQNPVTVATHTVTRTVRDIAHVIPGWAKALMAALGALLAVAAAVALAAALRNRRLRAQRAALLADVGALQAALLPIVPDHVGALAVSVAYRPAAGLAAGGDFYDVFPLDNGRVGILVGDVSGHGRESLRSATFNRHMVRSYLEAGLGPRTALQLAGTVVDQHDRDEFATLIAAVHDPTAGTLSYASAGHPPPIVTGPAAHEPMAVASSPPLGVESPTGLRQTTLPLPPGSAVCFFTDGLFEARRNGAIFGRRRLETTVHELGPDASADELIDRVISESDTMRDDVAVCMIRVDHDAAASGTVRVEELEVDASEVDGPRVRRFLEASGVAAAEIDDVLRTARRRTAVDGSVLLRVRLARDRSGVDVLPTSSVATGAAVATLAPVRAIER